MSSEAVGWPVARVALVAALAVAAGVGCASVDVRGRETLRLGPLRGVALAPTTVAPVPVVIDAGADALSDEELATIATALPSELQHALSARASAAVAPRALGTARIDGCRLRAGPGRAHTVYEARCRVTVVVNEVVVAEVHADALRRVRARAISEDEAKAIRKLVRNPLLSADDGRLALVAALDAAAAILVDGRVPPSPDAPGAAPLPRAARAGLAREHLARASAATTVRAALFDLSANGTPADAPTVLPFLAHDDVAVRVAAVDALGELCAPWSAERLEPLTAEHTDDPAVRAAAARALARVRTCASFPR